MACESLVGSKSLRDTLSCGGAIGGWPLALLWLAKHFAITVASKHESDYAHHRGCVYLSRSGLLYGIGAGLSRRGFFHGLAHSGTPEAASDTILGTARKMIAQATANPADCGAAYAFAAFCLRPGTGTCTRLLVGLPNVTVWQAMTSTLADAGSEQPSSATASGTAYLFLARFASDCFDFAMQCTPRLLLSSSMELLGRSLTHLSWGCGFWFDHTAEPNEKFHWEVRLTLFLIILLFLLLPVCLGCLSSSSSSSSLFA
jgi:hypothetical protein